MTKCDFLRITLAGFDQTGSYHHVHHRADHACPCPKKSSSPWNSVDLPGVPGCGRRSLGDGSPAFPRDRSKQLYIPKLRRRGSRGPTYPAKDHRLTSPRPTAETRLFKHSQTCSAACSCSNKVAICACTSDGNVTGAVPHTLTLNKWSARGIQTKS